MLDSLWAIFWASIGLLEDVARDYESAVAVIVLIAVAITYVLLRGRRRPAKPAGESD